MISVLQMSGTVHPPSARKRVTAMLKAYFDESGTHWGKGGSKFVVISGYIGPEDVWKTFNAGWCGMLSKPQITPRLKFFHAKDVEGNGSERFRKLTQRERETLKTDAVNVVTNCGLIGVSYAVEMSSWDRYAVGKVKEILGDPWMFAFQGVLTEAIAQSKLFLGESPKEKIAFIFDQHPRWSVLAHEMYIKLKRDKRWGNRKRLGALTFEDKEEFAPLQAADHIAYETWQYRNDPHHKRPAINRFLSWPQHHGKFFDDHGFTVLLKQFKESGAI